VTSTCGKLPESCAAHTIVRLPEIHALGPFRTRIRRSIKYKPIKYKRSIGYTLTNRLRSIDRTSIRGRQARMTDGQIARPSLARFRLPCGLTAVRPVRGHGSAVASLRPDVFVLVRRLRTRRPTANRTRAFRWTARRASGTSESAAGSDVRLRSAGSLRGGRRRTWQPFAAVERGRQAGGILRFLQTSLTFCSAERGRRAVAAIAYEGSLTIAQPLQPRPALMGRGGSGRTERRPRTPKPLLAKLLLPELLLPMCFPACAFYRVAQVSCD
jgi:hypothetical protein